MIGLCDGIHHPEDRNRTMNRLLLILPLVFLAQQVFASVVFATETVAGPRNIIGIVVDADGKPVAEASVGVAAVETRIFPWSFPEVAATKTTADGTFTIPIPKETTVKSVYAFKPGKGFDFRHYFPIDADDGDSSGATESVTFVLNSSRIIGIKAVDPDGKPVEGVRVKPVNDYFQERKNGEHTPPFFAKSFSFRQYSRFEQTTDKNGEARFDWFPDSRNAAIFEIQYGSPEKQGNEKHRELGLGRMRYFLEPGHDTLTVPLHRMVRFHGTVRGPDGKPLAEVPFRVFLSGLSADEMPNIVSYVKHPVAGFEGHRFPVTNSEGRFEFAVPEGSKFVCQVIGNKWFAAPTELIEADGEKKYEVIDFTVKKSTRIFGQVLLGPDDRPAQRAGVSLRQDGWIKRGFAQSDENGRFELYGGPGRFELYNWNNAETVKSINVPEDCEEFEVDFYIDDPKRGRIGDEENETPETFLRGRLVDVNDKPVSDVTITSLNGEYHKQFSKNPKHYSESDIEGAKKRYDTNNRSWKSGTNGRFSINGKVWRLRFEKDGYVPFETQELYGGWVGDIVLQKGIRPTVTVFSSSGKPIPNLPLRLLYHDTSKPLVGLEIHGPFYDAVTDTNGRAVFESVLPGRYMLSENRDKPELKFLDLLLSRMIEIKPGALDFSCRMVKTVVVTLNMEDGKNLDENELIGFNGLLEGRGFWSANWIEGRAYGNIEHLDNGVYRIRVPREVPISFFVGETSILREDGSMSEPNRVYCYKRFGDTEDHEFSITEGAKLGSLDRDVEIVVQRREKTKN